MTESLDTKEFELPKTIFSRDIETRVIQVIILNTLHRVEGVSLMGGTLIDSLLGREVERVKGITVEQDSKNHLLKVKIEVNMHYGVSIPDKSEEVQQQVVEEITKLTGLHVASVHIIVKGLNVQVEKEEQSYPASLLEEEDAIEEELKKS